MSCAIGVLAAYVNRLKTGVGEKVDIALVDSMVSSLEIINIIYLNTGRIPTRIGNRYEAIYPYDSFQARDGYVIIACGNDKLYGLLKNVLQISALEDEKFKSNLDRVAHHAKLKEIIECWTRDLDIDTIVSMLLDAGIPSAPINTIDRVTQDPHIAGAREMFVDIEHPVAGKITMTGNQVKFTHNKATIRMPAPTLGQHNYEVLKERLNYSDEKIEKLIRSGIL